MGKKTKNIIIVIIVLLLLFFIYRYFNGYKLSGSRGSAYDSQVASYNEYLQTQQAEYTDYMNRLNDQLQKSNELMEMNAKNQKRYELLLERWEKQADKMDLILDKLQE